MTDLLEYGAMAAFSVLWLWMWFVLPRRWSRPFPNTRKHFAEMTAVCWVTAIVCGIAMVVIPPEDGRGVGNAIAAVIALGHLVAGYYHFRIAVGIDDIPPESDSDDRS